MAEPIERCSVCVYWQADKATPVSGNSPHGDYAAPCWRFPPTANPRVDYSDWDHLRPRTHKDQWCGEFRSRSPS